MAKTTLGRLGAIGPPKPVPRSTRILSAMWLLFLFSLVASALVWLLAAYLLPVATFVGWVVLVIAGITMAVGVIAAWVWGIPLLTWVCFRRLKGDTVTWSNASAQMSGGVAVVQIIIGILIGSTVWLLITGDGYGFWGLPIMGAGALAVWMEAGDQ